MTYLGGESPWRTEPLRSRPHPGVSLVSTVPVNNMLVFRLPPLSHDVAVLFSPEAALFGHM